MEAHIHAKFENTVLPVSSYSTSSIVTDSYSLSIASLALLMVHIYFQALFARLGGNMSGLTYNLGQKVLRILLFLTHRRPTLRIWHHGDPSPHPSLVNVV